MIELNVAAIGAAALAALVLSTTWYAMFDARSEASSAAAASAAYGR